VKPRKWLWWIGGGTCVLAIALGYLVRPDDELAAMMQFHPSVQHSGKSSATTYTFQSTPSSQVLASIPGKRLHLGAAVYAARHPYGEIYSIDTPSGQHLLLYGFDRPGKTTGLEDARSCKVMVPIDNRPWHQRYWTVIKYRLGL
jgi:hypothetical protein